MHMKYALVSLEDSYYSEMLAKIPRLSNEKAERFCSNEITF